MFYLNILKTERDVAIFETENSRRAYHLRWQLIADRNEQPNRIQFDSSLSVSFGLVGMTSLDKNDWKVVKLITRFAYLCFT